MSSLVSTLLITALSLGVFGLLFWWAAKAIKRSASKYSPVDSLHKLAGVGGWLLFFITKMILIGPLMEIGTLNKELYEMEIANPALKTMAVWASYKMFSWSFLAVLIVISVFAGLFMIRNRTRSAVRRAITAIWLTGPVAFIPIIIGGQIILGVSAINAGEILGTFATSTLASILWTAYLLLSRRVKATYGSGKPAAPKLASESY